VSRCSIKLPQLPAFPPGIPPKLPIPKVPDLLSQAQALYARLKRLGIPINYAALLALIAKLLAPGFPPPFPPKIPIPMPPDLVGKVLALLARLKRLGVPFNANLLAMILALLGVPPFPPGLPPKVPIPKIPELPRLPSCPLD
jgi:hypothetical protein